MSHPLQSKLQKLIQLLQSNPTIVTRKEVVRALDKVTAAAESAIDLIEGAAAGASPEAQELYRLLERAFASPEDEKFVRAKLRSLLTKLPAKSKGLTTSSYIQKLVDATAKAGQAMVVCSLVRQHLNRPQFDTSTRDKYELLKQIRQLGRMDVSQKKAAKSHLLKSPEIVVGLCDAAGIPTASGKTQKPVAISTLVNKLIKHGERYAENAGD